MSWQILILPKAEDDLAWFRRHDRALYLKCFDLVRDLSLDPRAGLGKPKQLKHFDREVWSRRVSHKHRMVYTIYGDEQKVEIVSCKSHYESPV